MIPASPGLDWWLDLASLVLIVGAAVLTLAAGLGLVRFPDAMARLHAGTKPQILGLMLMIIAIGLQARSWSTLLMLTPIIVLQVLVAPVGAQMLARAAYRTENYDKTQLTRDELAESEVPLPSADVPPTRPLSES